MLKSIEQYIDTKSFCDECHSGLCNNSGSDKCKWGKDFDDFDLSKPGIMIIDDNEGICSFLQDDLEDDGKINLDDYNIFTFSTQYCAYDFIGTILKYKDLNIQKAIIDITYGGTVQTKKGNLKLNGVDVFEILYELNKDLKYLFYTGNQMNTHIKHIGELMNKYIKITNKKITENMIFKTQFSMNDRRDYIFKRLF